MKQTENAILDLTLDFALLIMRVKSPVIRRLNKCKADIF